MSIQVCHISTMTRWGGVERMLVDLLTQGTDSQFSHTLLTTSSQPDVMSAIQAASIKIYEPPRRFHYDPNAILKMAKWLKEQKVEVVHTYNSLPSAWGSMASALARVPVLVGGEHGTIWSVNSLMFWLNRWAYRQAKTIVVNSRASQLLVHKRFGIPHERMRVVYNVITSEPVVDTHNTFRTSTDELIIGSVGRLAAQKHYEAFIRAAALVLAQSLQVRFVLVGGGPQDGFLKNLANQLGVADRFIFTGWREDARELIAHFDIFVSTSLYEPFGNVLVEAGQAGKPVIAPNVDGIPEAILHGQTGVLVTPTIPVLQENLPKRVVIDGRLTSPKALDVQLLANEIQNLIQSPSLRRELGEAGKERASTLFTLERYQRELEDVYTACLVNCR